MPDNAKLAIDLTMNLNDVEAKAKAMKQTLTELNSAETAAKQQADSEAKATADAEARAKAEANVKAKLDDQVKALKQAADVQKLINQGKEKEAYILSQVQQAQRNAGSPLQRGQIVAVRQAASSAWDTKNADASVEAKRNAEEKARIETNVKSRLDDQVKTLKQAADVQKLINQGKEKEAYILSQVQQAQRANNSSPLSRGQIISVRGAAGAAYDARQKPQEAMSQMENLRRVVESSGGIIGREVGETASKVVGLGGSFASLGPAVASFGGIAAVAVIAIASIAVAAAKGIELFAEWTRKTMDSARETQRMSQALDISADKYQILAEMAEKAKANPETFLIAVRTSSAKIEDARRNPEGESAKALGRIGLKAADFEGKDAADQIALIAHALAALKGQAQDDALSDMFGRSSFELRKLINEFDAYKADAQAVARLDDETIAATHEFDEAMNDLGATLKKLTADTGIIQWLANVASNAYAAAKAFKDFAGQGGVQTLVSGMLNGLESQQYIGRLVTVLRFAGSRKFGQHGAEGAKENTSPANAATQSADAAERERVKQETKDKPANQMALSYKDAEAEARTLLETEKRRLEVRKLIREYNKTHGKNDQIGPDKAAEIEQAAISALEGQADADLYKKLRGMLDEANATRAITADLKQQLEIARTLRDLQEHGTNLTDAQKTAVEADIKESFAARRHAALQDMIQGYADEASGAKAVTAELKAQEDYRKKLRDFQKQYGSLSDEQLMAATINANDAYLAKQASALKEYIRLQHESQQAQDLQTQHHGREAAIIREVNATKAALGNSITPEQEGDARQRGGTRYDQEQKIALKEKLKDLDAEIKAQQLVNDGLLKKAYITRQLDEEEKARGSKLEGKDRQDFITKTGRLYGLQNAQEQKAQPSRYTSLEGIGGGYTGLRAPGGESTVEQIKKTNDLLQKNISSVDAVTVAVKAIKSGGTSTSYRTAR